MTTVFTCRPVAARLPRDKIALFGLVLLGLTLTACGQKTVTTHGHVITETRLNMLEEGVTTKTGVRRLLGTPPLTGAFDDNTWIYLTEQTQTEIFGQKALQNRKIITITFYPELETVKNITITDNTQSRNVTISDETTLTSGQSMGVIDQLLNNIGVSP